MQRADKVFTAKDTGEGGRRKVTVFESISEGNESKCES